MACNPDEAACLSQCAGFAPTPQYDAAIADGDSFACRMYHLMAAVQGQSVHCGHIVKSSPTCF